MSLMRSKAIVVGLMLAFLTGLASPTTANAQKTKDDIKKVDPKKVDPKKIEPKKEEPAKLEIRDDWPKVTGTLAQILAADPKKRTATVETADGKKADLTLNKEVDFLGPRGGKTDIDDPRFVAGRHVKLVYDKDGKTVKEVHLQVLKADDKKK